jgi:hypothetical protein
LYYELDSVSHDQLVGDSCIYLLIVINLRELDIDSSCIDLDAASFIQFSVGSQIHRVYLLKLPQCSLT